LLIVGYAFAGYAAAPHMLWWPDYLARGLNRGIASGAAAWLLWSLCAAAGPALFGLLADRVGGRQILLSGLALQVAALALSLVSRAEPVLVMSVMFAGATATGVSALVLNRCRVLAPEHSARLWSLCTSAYAATQTLAGFSLAYIYFLSDSHWPLFAAGFVAAVLALAFVLPGRAKP
jgi:predicted MFS family arabinose efflux permease